MSDRYRDQKGSGVSLKTLPSFFIIGPPRTGTSWLHVILRDHAILPVATKETRFFDTHFHRGLDWYRAHFRPTIDGQHVGEVAPTYFASVEARERIAQLLPNARVVCIFRNPLVETSRYTEHYRAWQKALGPGQVLATIYDDLCVDPQSYLDRLVDFLGVPRFALTSAQRRSVHTSDHLTHPWSYTCTRNATRLANWLKAQRFDKLVAALRDSPVRQFFLGGGEPFRQLSHDLAFRLCERFLPEVEKLEKTLQRSLPEWRCVRGQMPTCTTSGLNALDEEASAPGPGSTSGAVA